MSNCPTCGKPHKKTDEQRNLFHALCRTIGLHVGETPGKVKAAIKQDFYGLDTWTINGKQYSAVRPSEQSDRSEYSDLIEYSFQWAAENLGLALR